MFEKRFADWPPQLSPFWITPNAMRVKRLTPFSKMGSYSIWLAQMFHVKPRAVTHLKRRFDVLKHFSDLQRLRLSAFGWEKHVKTESGWPWGGDPETWRVVKDCVTCPGSHCINSISETTRSIFSRIDLLKHSEEKLELRITQKRNDYSWNPWGDEPPPSFLALNQKHDLDFFLVQWWIRINQTMKENDKMKPFWSPKLLLHFS